MVGVPVVHAAHAGSFVGQAWPDRGETFPSHYLGEAQIVDGNGRVLARMSREDGEGVITADISLGSVADEPDAIPDSFWIAEYPEELYRQWQSALETGHQYYLSTTLPNVKKLFDRPAQEQ
jgi:predicted amidohydrolase